MNWLENTREDIKQLDKNKVVILPIGSCEQHYTHLPVGTDTFIGEHILRKVTQLSLENIVVLPYIWFGFSQHHMDYAGSLTVRGTTLMQLTTDLCASIYKNGFHKIVLFNSHGGNWPALQMTVNEVAAEVGISPVLISYWSFLKEKINDIRQSPLGGIGHAGELETSLAMYLFSEHMGEIKGDCSYNSNPYLTYDMFSSNSYYTYKKFTEMAQGGLVGDPTYASKETGKRIFDLVTKELANFFQHYFKNAL